MQEGGSKGPNTSAFIIYPEGNGDTFYLHRGVRIGLLFGKLTPLTMGKGGR